MAEDCVFFLKTFPTAATKALPWPGPVRLIGIDPPAGCMCGGADKLCSTAYSCMWQSSRTADGRALPGFLARYAKGVQVGRVAFVGFSAAHGFLNPLLNNDVDRAAVSAVIMMDTCFGGGKTGFQKALRDAAAGRLLYATLTSHDGAPWKSASDLQSGTFCFERNVLAPSGLRAESTAPRPPAPQPSGGAYQIGELGYWLRFADAAGKSELPHYQIRTTHQDMMLAAYLIPYWKGELGGFPWRWVVLGAAAGAALAYGAAKLAKTG